MSPPINCATTPRQRAQMRLEYRLINLLGFGTYQSIQPLVRELLEASDAA